MFKCCGDNFCSFGYCIFRAYRTLCCDFKNKSVIVGFSSDTFIFNLPVVFIPDKVKERYSPYLKRMPSPTDSIVDVVNWSIQAVTVPGISYSPVEQTRPGFEGKHRGTSRYFRGSRHVETLLDRKFEVTFRAIDGYLNYWILLETFHHHYGFDVENPYTCDMAIYVKDGDGLVLYSLVFRQVLFTGIDQMSLNFSEQSLDSKTFNCSFQFNEMEIDFPIQ